jgi:PhnB protein
MPVQPYLFFDGRCEEALDFYRQALGAEELMVMRFKDAPDTAACPQDPANAGKIMHASFRIGGSEVMASDGRCEGRPKFEGFALSLTPSDETEAERLFHALAEGGQVQMPLAETFFSPRFGMVADRFGISWMVYVVPAEPAS